MEKKLIVALAAMVEIINRRAAVLSAEEDEAVVRAVELLAESQANCDDCVDY